jgi:Fe-S cluster assembly protein SufD
MTTATAAPAQLEIAPSTLDAFLSATNDPVWLLALRRQAFENFQRLPWPALKDEKWKRTGLDHMPWSSFVLPTGYDAAAKNAAIPAAAARATWIPLNDAVASQSEFLKAKWTAAVERAHQDKFLSLTLAFANAGGILRVPRGFTAVDPIVLSTRGESNAVLPLVFVVVEAGASVSLWDDTSARTNSGDRFVLNHTSFQLDQDAQVSLYSLESADLNTRHFQFQDVEQNASSRFSGVAVSVGSRVFHNETTLRLQGKGAENKILGVLFGDGEQVFENWITQLHIAPSTTSDIQYRGALKGSARSFFSGMVAIAKEAQRSDAFQSSKSLLLSTDARADAIPNLEILADDVKCSHGAAVGPVDEEQKFYLQTRGIPLGEAEEMIVQGFFEPVIAAIGSVQEQDRLRTFIEEKLR